jgi:hypothetical protein
MVGAMRRCFLLALGAACSTGTRPATTTSPIITPTPAACDRELAHWKSLMRENLADWLVTAHGELTDSDHRDIEATLATNAARIRPVCERRWSAELRGCILAATVATDFDGCLHAEYERSPDRATCERIIDRYMALTDVELADVYADKDAAWIAEVKTTQRAQLQTWCIESGVAVADRSACALAASTRNAVVSCAKPR